MTTRLRVTSFNLFSGRVLAPGGPVPASPAEVAEAIAATDADVLALQEVDVAQPRSGDVDQVRLATLALAGGGPVCEGAFAPTVAGTPGEPGWSAADAVLHRHRSDDAASPSPPGEPLFGVALVTRRPVESWRRFSLGRVPGRFPLPIPTGRSRRPAILWLHEEPRTVLAVRLLDPAVTVACTHLSFVPGASLVQLRRAQAWLVAHFPPPYLLLGDLNLPPRLASGQGWQPLVRAATYPGPGPRMQLDHVLGRDLAGWRVDAASAARPSIGDHLTVTVDLGRDPGAGRA